MKNKLKSLFVVAALALVVLLPVSVAFAQTTVQGACNGYEIGPNQNAILFSLCRISLFINTLIPILIALAVVYFMWGVIQYAIAKDEEAKTGGRDAMIWGLVALLVLTSMWGLVNILKKTFGVTDSSAIQVPCIESPGVYCPQTNS
jgi:hypothetical protein